MDIPVPCSCFGRLESRPNRQTGMSALPNLIFLFGPGFCPHALRMEAQEIQRVVQLSLAEDVGEGDITTLATVAPDATAKAVMIAREPLVVAGLLVAEAVFGELSPAIRISRSAKDGDHVTTGQSLLHISGPA